MKPNKWILSDQTDTEVKDLMISNNCLSCFGCPNATLLASKIIALSKSEHSTVDDRSHLEVLTRDCSGYSDNKPAVNPSEMCQSPLDDTPRVSIVAGKLLDILRLRF